MRHLNRRAVGLLAAVVIGCGPGKELPDTVPEPTGTKTGTAEPAAKVPATSEPAAKAVTDKAVAAITKNNPGQLAKAKVSRSVSRGQIHIQLDRPADAAIRRIAAVWPDRARVTLEFPSGIMPTTTLLYRDPGGWMLQGNTTPEGVDPAAVAPRLRTDLPGQHWMLLGLPLADPKAVVYDAQKAAGGIKAATTVKIALPERRVYQLTIDDQSGLITRVDYTMSESGQRVRKGLALADHKEAEGFMLPFTIEYSQNGQPAEKWTIESWEFPEKIDDATFDPPK